MKVSERDLKNFLAFRLKGDSLEPVAHPSVPDPDSLLFVDRQKEILFRNTAQFVRGFPANDVLLWGDRGTGKSSLVRSLLKPFGKEGLRIVQVYRWDIPSLTDLYEVLRRSDLRFILFFDDLSFEPSETDFKVLKSLLDGDIEERPENVLVYATSNRKNLMPSRWEEEDKFPQETLQERTSLAERFGIRLGFFAFTPDQYLEIVRNYLEKRGVLEEIRWEEVKKEAFSWARERGSFSGRVALQFAKDFEGRFRLERLKEPYNFDRT